jgi:hypothetical protein
VNDHALTGEGFFVFIYPAAEHGRENPKDFGHMGDLLAYLITCWTAATLKV